MDDKTFEELMNIDIANNIRKLCNRLANLMIHATTAIEDDRNIFYVLEVERLIKMLVSDIYDEKEGKEK